MILSKEWKKIIERRKWLIMLNSVVVYYDEDNR